MHTKSKYLRVSNVLYEFTRFFFFSFNERTDMGQDDLSVRGKDYYRHLAIIFRLV